MLSNRLRAMRKLENISISKLAKLSGVSKSYICKLENNTNKNPSAIKIYRLAETLGITPCILMYNNHTCYSLYMPRRWAEQHKYLNNRRFEKRFLKIIKSDHAEQFLDKLELLMNEYFVDK